MSAGPVSRLHPAEGVAGVISVHAQFVEQLEHGRLASLAESQADAGQCLDCIRGVGVS